ncbi:MAG TPA: hypothetical protein PK788_00105 [Gemmatimonadaceae bacterium]|nr:hypothetical protein [Gemmatimonadaceae bacterium]HRQ77622.1 hypothetical protein [Gemmatimonadaceae bacterium]
MASKSNRFLEAVRERVGEWVCSVCASGSGQPAATFRTVRNQGFVFEEVAPNRWGKLLYCDKCGMERTHYRLLNPDPEFAAKRRVAISSGARRRILKLLDKRDAFTGASISSTPEIDHKVPWTRLESDIDADQLSDSEIPRHFQLLTREHNLLKDRACSACKTTNQRPPLLGIRFWYKGNAEYEGSCVGCGWYDGLAWRHALNELIDTEHRAHKSQG